MAEKNSVNNLNILKILVIILISMLAGLFFFKESDLVYLLLVLFWVYIGKKFRIDYRIFVASALIILLLCPVFIVFNNPLVLKMGVMVFILLLSSILLVWV